MRAHGPDSTYDDADLAARLVPLTSSPRIRVTFNASVSDVLPWKFTPQQREVRVLPGETALAFYTATNNSDRDIIGVATYSVTPAQVAPYFSKIQCFCFEEQRLNAGETVDMPVFFYLDPDMVNDLNAKGIETVTLSYTFFSEFLLSVLSSFPCEYPQRETDFVQKQSTTTMGCTRRRRLSQGSRDRRRGRLPRERLWTVGMNAMSMLHINVNLYHTIDQNRRRTVGDGWASHFVVPLDCLCTSIWTLFPTNNFPITPALRRLRSMYDRFPSSTTAYSFQARSYAHHNC